MDLTSTAPSVLASFMASMVECVEALTIVLAVGTVRGWRPAILGATSALGVLALLVLTLGGSLAQIPLEAVQLVVGVLLLLFGLRWLRKAILRSAGVIALHDEAKAFMEETAALRQAGAVGIGRFDRTAFFTAFKITMLEGIEVVFIVIALSAGGKMMVPSIVGALFALVAVVALGLWLHKPLSKVPENTLKFCVGVMLTAFGTFWVGEGIGLDWPGADLAILALTLAYLAVAIILVPLCRGLRRPPSTQRSSGAPAPTGTPSWIAAAWSGVVGFFVDDGLLAAGTVLSLLIIWAVEGAHAVPMPTACVAFAIGLLATLGASAVKRSRAH